MTNSISKFYQTQQQLWSRWCEEYSKNLTGKDKNEWMGRRREFLEFGRAEMFNLNEKCGELNGSTKIVERDENADLILKIFNQRNEIERTKIHTAQLKRNIKLN